MATTLKALGDPQKMRPSTNRTDFGFADPIGKHPLADGREAWVLWLHHTQTHVHIVVWIPGSSIFEVVKNVARFNAGTMTEKIFKQLEI